MQRNPVGKLLLFGATGDLAQRMLLPSLYGLHADKLLPDGLTITGTARSEHDDDSFREFARKALGRVSGKDALELRPRDAPRDAYFVDRAFANEMAALAEDTAACYAAMRWRDGIQAGAFALQLARDAYRDWCARSDVPMHAGLLADYVRLAAALIAPVCPHFAHHVWRNLLGESGPLRWPADLPDVDRAMARSYDFLKKTARALRLGGASRFFRQVQQSDLQPVLFGDVGRGVPRAPRLHVVQVMKSKSTENPVCVSSSPPNAPRRRTPRRAPPPSHAPCTFPVARALRAYKFFT